MRAAARAGLLPDEQGAGGKGKDARDAAAVHALIQDTAVMTNQELHIGISDVMKAFDTTHHDAIIHYMKHVSFPDSTIQQMALRLRGNQAVVETVHGLTQPIPILSSIMQGSVYASFIFCLLMNVPIEMVKKTKLGFAAFGKCFPVLGYVDDMRLYGESQAALQKMFEVYQSSMKKIGLLL
jgi:Reverse transcriptase (RNA-dependent DNA polymerase)